MGRQDYDWEKVEKWFIEESGAMSYRQVAEKSDRLACFGYKKASYELIREIAKENLWMDKRTAYQAEQHSGILDDYRRSYKLITLMLDSIDAEDPLNARDLYQLGQLQLKYGEAIMAINPPSMGSDDVEMLTRDDVLQIIRDTFVEEPEPVELMAEETPE